METTETSNLIQTSDESKSGSISTYKAVDEDSNDDDVHKDGDAKLKTEFQHLPWYRRPSYIFLFVAIFILGVGVMAFSASLGDSVPV